MYFSSKRLIIAVIVAFLCISRLLGTEVMSDMMFEKDKLETQTFELEVEKLHHELDVEEANEAQKQQGHDGIQIDHAMAADISTKFDAQVNTPLYKLIDNGQYEGSLTIVASREVQQGEEYASGQTMFQLGKIENPSPMGYIEDVWTYDVQSKSFYAISKIHRQAILLTCGQESLDLLENRKAISMNAWLYTGGDMVNAATTGVKSYLHILERRITQADIDAIGI